MKKCKLLLVALLSATLLFTPTKIQANETNIYDSWKQETIISPSKGQLVPAGVVNIEFKALVDGNIKITSYEVYLDDVLQNTIQSNGSETYEIEVYTTKVTKHVLQVVAISEDDYQIHSNIRTFLVSKKGIGLDKNKNMDDMNLSWYYNWDKEPSTKVDKSIEYVPMIWSAYEGSINWLQNESKNYHTVLGFNEPDLSDQANITPQKAADYQHYFSESNLRVGAPVVAYDPSNNTWFSEYSSKIDLDEIDFIPMHVYYDWGGEGMAEALLKAIDDTYEKYKKPIWITEYGLSNIWLYGAGNASNINQIKQYMRDTIAGFEERDYVERYAWFSFGIDSTSGGATALCNQDTGTLTPLGELYKSLGNPTIGAITTDDQYIDEVGYYGKWDSIVNQATTLKNSLDYSQYTNRETFELALAQAIQLDKNIPIKNQDQIDKVVRQLEEEYLNVLGNKVVENPPQKIEEPSAGKPQIEEPIVSKPQDMKTYNATNNQLIKTSDDNNLNNCLFLSIGALGILLTQINRKRREE